MATVAPGVEGEGGEEVEEDKGGVTPKESANKLAESEEESGATASHPEVAKTQKPDLATRNTSTTGNVGNVGASAKPVEKLKDVMKILELDSDSKETVIFRPKDDAFDARTISKPGARASKNKRTIPDWGDPTMAASEQKKMESVLLKASMTNPVTLYLPEEDRVDLIRDLSKLTYPVVADLLESVNTLAFPLSERDPTPPRKVSVLVDPFCIYEDGDTDPTTGAIAFIKSKNKVRPPIPCKPRRPITEPTPATILPLSPRVFHSTSKPTISSSSAPPLLMPPSSQENPTPTPPAAECKKLDKTPNVISKLAEIMAEALEEELLEEREKERQKNEKGEDPHDQEMDYNFLSLDSTHLPTPVRNMVESTEREMEMETVMITKADYRHTMEAVAKYGVSHSKTRHRDTDSVVLLPNELKMEHGTLETAKTEEVPRRKRSVNLDRVLREIEAKTKAAKVGCGCVW